LKQELRLAAAAWGDAKEMNPDAKFLSLLNTDTDVLVSRQENSVAHGAVAGEVDHVCHNKGVHALLLAGTIHETEAHFHAGLERKSDVFR
jgi:hypothetical protein